MDNKVGWLTIILLVTFLSVSWMVWIRFTPFIQLEKKVALLFEKLFGHPQMTYSNGFFNALLTFLVNYGSAFYLSSATVVISIFLFLKGEFYLGVSFLGVMSTGGILGGVLKNFFKRPRPNNSLAVDSGYSFPSGHAIASSLFFWTIILLLVPALTVGPLRIFLSLIFFMLWFLIIFSRLYFHAHHLGDLIVGVSYAIFWVRSGIFIYQYLFIQ